MDDATIEGLEVEVIEGEDALAALEGEGAFSPLVPGALQRWQGQLRRAGSQEELPGAQQRYLDYPAWLTAPHRNPAHERLTQQ